VEAEGAEQFFGREDWLIRLEQAVSASAGGRWEGNEERRERFRADLEASKRRIEDAVPGARVRALALPWAAMHPDIPAVAQQTGYELVVLGYPFSFAGPQDDGSLPLYPRLKGDAIWMLLEGPLRGPFEWARARYRYLARNRSGSVS
jgi:hypothetical protein